MSIANDIRDLFTIFHDGSIVAIEKTDNDLRLKIDIQYLAELIEKDFEYFEVLLQEVHTFELATWNDGLITDPAKIAALEFGIQNADLNDTGSISVLGNYYPEGGGTLTIDAAAYVLYDQRGDRMSLDQLKELSRYYWEEVMGR
jgi:hypothetical protein